MSSQAMDVNTGIELERFKSQMQAFANWKAELTETIKSFQTWLNENDRGNPEMDLRIYNSLEALHSDRLNIGFVAEFSRGKTELINAIFFADFGRRLLPSDAGRTTMCPTELFYDIETDESYIRLLPIETRLNDISLSDLKRDPAYWTKMSLDVTSPDQMAEAFKEVIRTKQVSRDEAESLGLYDEELHNPGSDEEKKSPPSTIEIPLWRHAVISFPHPLLKQGIVILDTPGLNALGSEPELTLNMLPSAQAVFFILSADTGVTRSDLDMWQNHIKALRKEQKSGLVAVLNKVDIMWDEMKEDAEVEASIHEQCVTTAKMLDIDPSNVFPVSAQKALVAKTRDNPELLKRSNLLALESLLATEILPKKQRMIWDNVINNVDNVLVSACNPVTTQLREINEQLDELDGLRGKNEDVVQRLLLKAKTQKAAYYESVKNFQASRRKLSLQAKTMFNTLGMESIDTMIKKTREDMTGSWTTVGMKTGMKVFFDSCRDAIQIVDRHSNQTHQLVKSIYIKFQEEHNLQIDVPREFPIEKYISELDKLYLGAEEFRESTFATVGEQSFVVKKFFITLVSHVRQIFAQANKEAEAWFNELINPLVNQIQDKRTRIDQYMEALSKIKESKNTLEQRVAFLEKRQGALQEQEETLQGMRKKIQNAIPDATADVHDEPSNKQAVQ